MKNNKFDINVEFFSLFIFQAVKDIQCHERVMHYPPPEILCCVYRVMIVCMVTVISNVL